MDVHGLQSHYTKACPNSGDKRASVNIDDDPMPHCFEPTKPGNIVAYTFFQNCVWVFKI